MSGSLTFRSWALLGRRRERVDPLGVQIAAALKTARLNAGFTQEGLADKIGCRGNSISRAEIGKNNASPELIEAWLSACGVEIVVSVRPRSG